MTCADLTERSWLAGSKARKQREPTAGQDSPNISPKSKAAKAQGQLPCIIVDGTAGAASPPPSPPSVHSPFAQHNISFEHMSCLLVQHPRRCQPPRLQHNRSLSAELPCTKQASSFTRSRTHGYLDRPFMASVSTSHSPHLRCFACFLPHSTCSAAACQSAMQPVT